MLGEVFVGAVFVEIAWIGKNKLLRFILNGLIKDWNSWKKMLIHGLLRFAEISWNCLGELWAGDSSSYSWQATLRTRTWTTQNIAVKDQTHESDVNPSASMTKKICKDRRTLSSPAPPTYNRSALWVTREHTFSQHCFWYVYIYIYIIIIYIYSRTWLYYYEYDVLDNIIYIHYKSCIWWTLSTSFNHFPAQVCQVASEWSSRRVPAASPWFASPKTTTQKGGVHGHWGGSQLDGKNRWFIDVYSRISWKIREK